MSSITIRKTDITALDTDAVVNAANSSLLMGGGVCGAIFRAAGAVRLQVACARIGHCRTGDAVITPGFDLKAGYVIHAVGPVWYGGNKGEPELLYSAYMSALNVAKDNGLHSVAFPLISSGIYGYPHDLAWDTALKACRDFIDANSGYETDIVFAVIDDGLLELGQKTMAEKNIADKM